MTEDSQIKPAIEVIRGILERLPDEAARTLVLERAASYAYGTPEPEDKRGYTAKRLTASDLYDVAELLRASLEDAHWSSAHPRFREIREKMIERFADILGQDSR